MGWGHRSLIVLSCLSFLSFSAIAKDFRLALDCAKEDWMPATSEKYQVVKVGTPNKDPKSKNKYSYRFVLEVLSKKAKAPEVFEFDDPTDGDGDGDQAYTDYPIKASDADIERIRVQAVAVNPGFRWARLINTDGVTSDRCEPAPK
jgi:hypothetical protein